MNNNLILYITKVYYMRDNLYIALFIVDYLFNSYSVFNSTEGLYITWVLHFIKTVTLEIKFIIYIAYFLMEIIISYIYYLFT